MVSNSGIHIGTLQWKFSNPSWSEMRGSWLLVLIVSTALAVPIDPSASVKQQADGLVVPDQKHENPLALVDMSMPADPNAVSKEQDVTKEMPEAAEQNPSPVVAFPSGAESIETTAAPKKLIEPAPTELQLKPLGKASEPSKLQLPSTNKDLLSLKELPTHTTEIMEANAPEAVLSVNPSQSQEALPLSHANYDIVIAVTTMRRWTRDRQPAPERYLTNLVEGIVQDLDSEELKHTKFILYNVDKEPEKHQDLHDLKAKFPNLIDVLTKPQKPNHQMPSATANSDQKIVLEKPSGEVLEVSSTTMDWISGETHDATTLLFDARKRAPYVLFLEDDVKPTRNAVTKLSVYLDEMSNRGVSDWFMLDLYTPKINWGRNPLYVKNYERYDYECCTQAMLFRSDKLLDLLLYETLHSGLPIDDNIRDFSREDDTRGVYPVEPNLFEHIGRYSSNPEKSSETVEHQSLNFVP